MKVWIFAKSNAHRKTNAGGSFETQNFFFLALFINIFLIFVYEVNCIVLNALYCKNDKLTLLYNSN